MTKTDEIMELADAWMLARLKSSKSWSDVRIERDRLESAIEALVADAEKWRKYKARKDEVIAAGMGRNPMRSADPCKGQNCKSTNGVNHSIECRDQHAASCNGWTMPLSEMVWRLSQMEEGTIGSEAASIMRHLISDRAIDAAMQKETP